MTETKAQRDLDALYVRREQFLAHERNVDRSFENLKDAIVGLTNKIDHLGSTDWKMLAAFAAVLMSFTAAFARPYVQKVETLEERVRLQADNTRDRWTEDDERQHQAQEALKDQHRSEAFEARIVRIEESFNRKLELHEVAMRERIQSALDAPLERLRAAEESLRYYRDLAEKRDALIQDLRVELATVSARVSAE